MLGSIRRFSAVRGYRRAGTDMDVDFYSLERKVQDRFADATRAIGVPTPILREPPADRATLVWVAIAACTFASLVAWVLRGFGSLDSPFALSPLSFLAGYAALFAVVAFCLLRVGAKKAALDSRPYQPGLYLFPAGLFDARSDPLRVFRHPDVRKVEVIGGRVIRLSVEGANFDLRLPDEAAAEQVRAALDAGKQQLEHAHQTANRREQAMLDPLVDSGFSSPFSPQARLFRHEPMWAKLALPMALAAGVLLGAGTWKLRNTLSERRLYIAATAKGDAVSYRAYLARGGKRPEVAQLLLPRAELALAEKEGTVEALEQFSAAHPGTAIATEVDAAIRKAVSVELEAAKAVGTVSALREFRDKRVRYAFVQPAVEAAIVTLYKKSLETFSPGKDPAIVSFFERLLGFTKKFGPEVRIVFVRRIPESVDAADGNVKRSAYFMGKQSIPSQYFTGDYAEHREQAAWEALANALSAPFPRDILMVVPKETITDPGAIPPAQKPTLTVDYAPEMAGGYMSPKPRGVFVGVGMTFKATFAIPADSQPLELKFSQWRAPNPLLLKREGATVADVYEHMAAEGFDRFEKSFFQLLGLKG